MNWAVLGAWTFGSVALTLLWKLKMVTERHTSAVMPRHRTTDLVL